MFPTLIVAGMATAQITYLVTTSAIFDKARDAIGGIHSEVRYWIYCPWCFSAWVSLAVTLALGPAKPVLAWAAIWWIGCVGYWLGQALEKAASA